MMRMTMVILLMMAMMTINRDHGENVAEEIIQESGHSNKNCLSHLPLLCGVTSVSSYFDC